MRESPLSTDACVRLDRERIMEKTDLPDPARVLRPNGHSLSCGTNIANTGVEDIPRNCRTRQNTRQSRSDQLRIRGLRSGVPHIRGVVRNFSVRIEHHLGDIDGAGPIDENLVALGHNSEVPVLQTSMVHPHKVVTGRADEP